MQARTKYHWRRLRPRFTLRFLFLAITIFAIWLGWQVSIVRHRKALLDAVVARTTEDYKPLNTVVRDDHSEVILSDVRGGAPTFLIKHDIAWYRKLLGDRAVPLLCLPGSMKNEEVAEYRVAFPESNITQIEEKYHPQTQNKP